MIHIDEKGVPPEGEVKTMQFLTFSKPGKLLGTFTTLGWEHSGTVEWTKQ